MGQVGSWDVEGEGVIMRGRDDWERGERDGERREREGGREIIGLR